MAIFTENYWFINEFIDPNIDKTKGDSGNFVHTTSLIF